MPSSKGKKKKCYILVNLAGLALFRPQSGSHGFKLSSYAPTYDITEIVHTDLKRRDVRTRTESFYFICDHPDEAVAWINASREALFQGSSNHSSIILTGFPSKLPTVSPDPLPTEKSIAQMRYVCTCFRYSLFPPAEPFIRFFGNLDSKTQKTIYLDSSYEPPFNLKCLLVPILECPGFTRLYFRGFAPNAVCRLTHHLLKHSGTIRTVILDGYQTLIPAQLRLENLKYQTNEVLSFSFLNCKLDEAKFSQLVESLAKFRGEYQKLSFNGVRLTGALCKTFFSTLKHARCCRTLELLELDQIDGANCPADRISKGLSSTLRKLRFIQSISVSRWTPALKLQLTPFVLGHSLTELILQQQDLSPVMAGFQLAPALRLVDFTRCTFTCVALQKLFETLSQPRDPLSLVLAGISLPDQHWSAFFDGLPQLPAVTCLSAFDWSGNRLTSAALDHFVRFFIEPNPIRFLSIGRIFKTARLEEFISFMGRMRPGLWGLSLGGGPDANFAGNLQHALRCLDSVPSLAVLHLDGQLLTESDTDAFAQWLPRHRAIVEVAMDGTAVASEPVLATTYQAFAALGIRAVGRPEADIRRLNGAPKGIDRIRGALQGAIPASTAAVRANFLAVHPGEFSAKEYTEFCTRYPPARNEAAPPGAFFPEFVPPVPPLRSLAELRVSSDVPGLNGLHVALLADPGAPPPWQAVATAADDSLADEGRTQGPATAMAARRSMTIHLRRGPLGEAGPAGGFSPPAAAPSPLGAEAAPLAAPAAPSSAPAAAVALEAAEIVAIELVPVPEVSVDASEEAIAIPENAPAAVPEFLPRFAVSL